MATFYLCDKCGKEYNPCECNDDYFDYSIVRYTEHCGNVHIHLDLCDDCRKELFGFLKLDKTKG